MVSLQSSPAIGATITWLTEGARSASTPQDVLHQLCSQLWAAGLAIDRCAAYVTTLHPNVMGRRFLWHPGDEVQINEADYDILESDLYRQSTVAVVMQTGKAVRLRVADPACQEDYNIIDDLRAEGFTDYVIYPLSFLNDQSNAISWATRHQDGFSSDDLSVLLAVREPLARIAEIYALRRVAGTLLDTYVGRRTGARILEGRIRRGDIDTIYAAILMADLRGFTALSNTKPAHEVVDTLNTYYDALVPAIEDRGGEILKFMGDGLLAIFPIDDNPRAVCDTALLAAEDGQKRLLEEGSGQLQCGMALNLGEVLYGNIGSTHRLDFTAIGRAVNLTARLEPLTREFECPVVTSADFAEACSRSLRRVGKVTLRGFDGDVSVFAPGGQRPDPLPVTSPGDEG